MRLLQSGFIRPEDLLDKYRHELHANEMLLLAYYIAAVNIEAAFHDLIREVDPEAGYLPFDGIVLTDTFQMAETGDTMDEIMFPQNNDRILRQQRADIRVIIGNPPYSAGQTSQNDANQNQKYPTLDAAIERSYAARSTATNKNSLYDSYIRAIRWATDRIGDNGVVAYVSNGGYIDGNTADGLRLSLVDEFSAIYCWNLRGNQRTSGENSNKEGGKIFGSGSRNTVAILILVKSPAAAGPCALRYADIGDYLNREEKLAIVAREAVGTVDWQVITPSPEGDWISSRSKEFASWTPIGQKEPGTKRSGIRAFGEYTAGLKTNRDSWVYSHSGERLEALTRRMIAFYNSQESAFSDFCVQNGIVDRAARIDAFIDRDPRNFSWNRGTRNDLVKGRRYAYRVSAPTIAAYRPFTRQTVYFDRQLNDMVYQLPKAFPTPQHHNIGIYLTGVSSHYDFTPFITNLIPDLHLLDTGQFFPRYTYVQTTAERDLFSDDTADEYTRVDNITDAILADYRTTFGATVTKDDIFYYVYGVLHSPIYRETYAADLQKMLPRIPKLAGFRAFSEAGRALADLHINYERVEPYPGLTETITDGHADPDVYRVIKMRFPRTGAKADKSTVIYNSRITVSGIPLEAHRYQLGSRSAIEWIIDRYQIRTDKPSGIVNDPNDWATEHDQPRYILDLLQRIVTVSMRTMTIVDALPDLTMVEEPGR